MISICSTRPLAAALAVLALAACQPGQAASVASTPTGLTIAPEDTGAHYRRDDWPTWAQVGDGCDAREHALKTQGRRVTTGKNCRVLTGEWVSPYDEVRVTDPAALDVDHVVPLKEANRSGTRNWTRKQRETFANDPAVLVIATAKTNRAKGDRDPARWLPSRNQCGYVQKWVAIKRTYKLTADQAEADAITRVLAHCPARKGEGVGHVHPDYPTKPAPDERSNGRWMVYALGEEGSRYFVTCWRDSDQSTFREITVSESAYREYMRNPDTGSIPCPNL